MSSFEDVERARERDEGVHPADERREHERDADEYVGWLLLGDEWATTEGKVSE